MKKISFIIIVIFAASLIYAQPNKFSLGGSGVISFPTSDFGDVANTGFGFLANGLYTVAPQIDITATAGYITFGSDFDNVDFSDIPVVVGARYYFTKNKVKPYGDADIGLHFLKVGFETYKIVGFQLQKTTDSESKTKFGLGLGGGVKVEINKKMSFDANIKYYLVSDGEQFMIRLGVVTSLD